MIKEGRQRIQLLKFSAFLASHFRNVYNALELELWNGVWDACIGSENMFGVQRLHDLLYNISAHKLSRHKPYTGHTEEVEVKHFIGIYVF